MERPTRRPVNEPGPRAAATASRSSGPPPARLTSASRRASTGWSSRRRTQSSVASTRRPSNTTIAWSTPEVSIARRIFKHRTNAIGSAQQRQPPPVVTTTGQTDEDGCPAFQHTGALRPLDQGDRIGGRFIEPGVDPGEALQAIQIVVLDGHSPCVLMMQDERRTVHTSRYAQRLRNPFDQFRF